MDGHNLLEAYKFLIDQQGQTLDIEEEEQILDELDKLWYAMPPSVRKQADEYISSLLTTD